MRLRTWQLTPSLVLAQDKGAAHWTHDGKCHMQPLNHHMNAFVTVTYLVLFSSFFLNRYIKPAKPVKAAKKVKSK